MDIHWSASDAKTPASKLSRYKLARIVVEATGVMARPINSMHKKCWIDGVLVNVLVERSILIIGGCIFLHFQFYQGSHF